MDTREGEAVNRLFEEEGAFPRFDQEKLGLWTEDLPGEGGKAGAGTDVHDREGAGGQGAVGGDIFLDIGLEIVGCHAAGFEQRPAA